jgi:single-strand DNA-binding protein
MAERSINRVTLLGRIGQDSELKYTPSGAAVSNFSVATSRRWKGQNDEWKEETDWHRVVLWRSENINQYLTKGSRIHLEGRLQTRSWEKDGEKKYATEIVAQPADIILLGAAGEGGQPRQAAKPPAAKNAPAAPYGGGYGGEAFDAGAVKDDDVPF